MFQMKEIDFQYQTLQFCSKISHLFSHSLFTYRTINESAKDDRKLGDDAYEEVNMKYIVLKGYVKKGSNYV